MNAPTVVTETLDRFERDLPALPSRWVRLNRDFADATAERARYIGETVANNVVTVLQTVKSVSDKTVAAGLERFETTITSFQSTGEKVATEARERLDDTAQNVEKTSKKVASAGRKRAGEAVKSAESTADKAVTKVDPKPARGYETWSKSDLYARAQELDIPGRTSMNRRQLVAALRDS